MSNAICVCSAKARAAAAVKADEETIAPRPVVSGMAQGMAMTLIPSGRELTTQEAADLLQMSRPTVIRLLEDGTIPFHKVGTHRRINVEDALAYRAKRNEQRRTTLRELTVISEEIGYR